jgi:hypothetical protein
VQHDSTESLRKNRRRRQTHEITTASFNLQLHSVLSRGAESLAYLFLFETISPEISQGELQGFTIGSNTGLYNRGIYNMGGIFEYVLLDDAYDVS